MTKTKLARLPKSIRQLSVVQGGILDCEARFVVALCGRRVGKTHIGPLWVAKRVHRRMSRLIRDVRAGKRTPWTGIGKTAAHAQYERPDVYAWVVAPRDAHLDEIRGNFMRLYSGVWSKFLNPSFPDGLYDRGSQLWLYQGGVAAKIEFIPASSEARMAGKGLDVLWIDEAGFIQNRLYRVIRPATYDRRAEILATGTPDTGDTHWFNRMSAAGLDDDHERNPRDFAERDPDIKTFIADTRYDAAVLAAREEALRDEKQMGDAAARLLFAADWRIPSRMVYDEWSPRDHIIDYDASSRRVGKVHLPNPDKVYGCIDWSYKADTPGAAIMVHYWRRNPLNPEDKRPLIILVEDAQEKMAYTDDGWWGVLRGMARRHSPVGWYADPHSPHLIKAANIAQHGCADFDRFGKVMQADARDKAGRIVMVKSLLHFDKGLPPALYVSGQCSEFPRQFSNYKYRTDRVTGDITEKTIDYDDHCLDALAFVVGKVYGGVPTTLRIGRPTWR